MLTSPRAGTGDQLKPKEILGHLLIVRPLEFLPEFETQFGPTDAIRVDVVDLTETDAHGNKGVVYKSVMWFNRVLVNNLRQQIGETVLGKMGQGAGKPGQSPPMQLNDAMGDPKAVAQAEQFLNKHPEFESAGSRPAQNAEADNLGVEDEEQRRALEVLGYK